MMLGPSLAAQRGEGGFLRRLTASADALISRKPLATQRYARLGCRVNGHPGQRASEDGGIGLLE
jgi:hypothetical protein